MKKLVKLAINNLWNGIADYRRYARETAVLDDVSNAFVERLAEDSVNAKANLRDLFSRSDAWKLIPSFFKAVKTIRQEKPDAIITTGAAPGLICVFAGWLLRRKTIWIDSIANVNRLSLSGRIAALFVSRVYTQWQHLATAKIHYAGDIFG